MRIGSIVSIVAVFHTTKKQNLYSMATETARLQHLTRRNSSIQQEQEPQPQHAASSHQKTVTTVDTEHKTFVGQYSIVRHLAKEAESNDGRVVAFCHCATGIRPQTGSLHEYYRTTTSAMSPPHSSYERPWRRRRLPVIWSKAQQQQHQVSCFLCPSLTEQFQCPNPARKGRNDLIGAQTALAMTFPESCFRY